MLQGISESSELADTTQDLQETLAFLEQLLQGTWGTLKRVQLWGTRRKRTLSLLILAWEVEMKIGTGNKTTLDQLSLETALVFPCSKINRARWCHRVYKGYLWRRQASSWLWAVWPYANFGILGLSCFLILSSMTSGAQGSELTDKLQQISPWQKTLPSVVSSWTFGAVLLDFGFLWSTGTENEMLTWSQPALRVSSLPLQEPQILILFPFLLLLFPNSLVA